MSESDGNEQEQGEFDVEENREDEKGSGYGASEQGDDGIEGPGDQSGVGELEEKGENWAG